jgi:hypothetical protein
VNETVQLAINAGNRPRFLLWIDLNDSELEGLAIRSDLRKVPTLAQSMTMQFFLRKSLSTSPVLPAGLPQMTI